MPNDETDNAENAPVIDPGGQGTGGGTNSISASTDDVKAFAAAADSIDASGQGTGGGGSVADAPIDPGGQGTGGGQ